MSLRRPILKGFSIGEAQSISSFRGGHVHFPPTPEISATYIAHSARIYDRSAIIVSPNICALPRRHCPDRTYVLTEGKGEARLLKSVQPKDIQKEDEDEDEDTDDRSCAEYDQLGAVRMDYFSIPSPSSMAESWLESDISDDRLSPSEVTSNCDQSQLPMLGVSVHDMQTHQTSEPHEHFQTALSFLPHPLPPVMERKRKISLRDCEKQGRAHIFSEGEDSNGPLARSRRSRRASSFTQDLPPDSGCLGGF